MRNTDASTSPKVTNSSFANVVNATRNVQIVNFRALINEDRVDNHDTMLPMAAMKKLFVYFERIRAANLAEEEELRAYIEEARQRIVEIDLYLFELGRVFGSTVAVHGRRMLRLVRFQDVSRIVLYTRAADEARYNADLLREFIGSVLRL
ncbi:hypothetical protein CTI12_AA421110 [Artemisia annua]|uniref:Uncharacterized protein n=1 Tax=Artemisia annua TaxID=35608 RepID=A0A2U1M5R4_ARTAN|nr:hypothetical protein CTI12_AA421110 [Artemisia annua]